MAVGSSRQNRRGPGRWWWLLGRLLLVFTVVAALGVLILNRTAPNVTKSWRATATDAAAPVLDGLGAPLRGASAAWDWMGSFVARGARVRALEAANQQMTLDAEQARERATEHAQLRALLKVAEPRAGVVRTARIVGASAASYTQSAVITAGASAGISANQPVRDPTGLVGQIVEVGRWSARVLLITDGQSRIPVRNSRTGQPGYAVGQNAALLGVSMAEPGSDVQVQDSYVTSGEGGIFPPGIAVGAIVSTARGELVLAPAAQLRSLSYALILRPYIAEPVHPAVVPADVLPAADSDTLPPGP